MLIKQEVTFLSVIHLSLIVKYPFTHLCKKKVNRCALQRVARSPCGPAPGQDDVTIIPVKSCNKDLSKPFFALGVSGSTGTVQNAQICGEADILFNRSGCIFPTEKQIEEFTVCPGHSYSLTYGWAGRKRLTCCHPNHSGKRNL